MTTPNLAKIERVADLRAAWPNEPQDFTPWLADNLDLLGEALGMDLEVIQTEAPVGGYKLDILATDLSSDRPVIIENQLGATEHKHLGQLLTYAAGVDAGVVVWVTKQLRDEQRQVLDWLNQKTDETAQFFGIEVQLWRIDDSRLAPHFNLAVTPNGWRKEGVVGTSDDGTEQLSEKRERYRDFFQSLINVLRENHKFTNAKTGKPRNWHLFATGRSNLNYQARFSNQDNAVVEIRIRLNDAQQNRKVFNDLLVYKDQIEKQLGATLVWDPMEESLPCRIALTRPGSIEDDDDTLDEIQAWMVENLLKFKEVFTPYLGELVN